MSVDILRTSCDQCRSMVQYSFTSTETRRLVRTDSPGRPPRLSHSSWTMKTRCTFGGAYVPAAFTRMPGGNYRRRFRSLLLSPLLCVWALSSTVWALSSASCYFPWLIFFVIAFFLFFLILKSLSTLIQIGLILRLSRQNNICHVKWN